MSAGRKLGEGSFLSAQELAGLLSVDVRTVRRYLDKPEIREMLGASKHQGRWRVPQLRNPAAWADEIRSRLREAGLQPGASPAIQELELVFRGSMPPVLRSALQMSMQLRLRALRRPVTESEKANLDDMLDAADAIRKKHHCKLSEVADYFESHIKVRREADLEQNRQAKLQLCVLGCWEEAQQIFRRKPSAILEVVTEDGQPPHGSGGLHVVHPTQYSSGIEVQWQVVPSTSGYPLTRHRFRWACVPTASQLARKLKDWQKLWPPKERIEKLERDPEATWKELNFCLAIKKIKVRQGPPTASILGRLLFADPLAQLNEKPGISVWQVRENYAPLRSWIGRFGACTVDPAYVAALEPDPLSGTRTPLRKASS